jgi:hypothetical protein
MRTLLAWILVGGLATASSAATTSGSFNVTVRLNEPVNGVCISTSLSSVTNALVRVTCEGNQFVSIEPRPGRPFIGTHGGAYRFAFSQRSGFANSFVNVGQSVSELEAAIGKGTITALRVLDLTEKDERLELLVSF